MMREGLKALTLTLAMSALSANADTLVATLVDLRPLRA